MLVRRCALLAVLLGVPVAPCAQGLVSSTEALGYDVNLLRRTYSDERRIPVSVDLMSGESPPVRLSHLGEVIEELWNAHDSLDYLGLEGAPLIVEFTVRLARAQDVQFFWPDTPTYYHHERSASQLALVEVIVSEALRRLRFWPVEPYSGDHQDTLRMEIRTRLPPPPRIIEPAPPPPPEGQQ